MNVTIVTAFPGFFRDFLSESMIGREIRNGLIRVDVVDLRDFDRDSGQSLLDFLCGVAFALRGSVVRAAPGLFLVSPRRGWVENWVPEDVDEEVGEG